MVFDLAELNAVDSAVGVLELEAHLLGVGVHVRELDLVVVLHAPFKLVVTDFVPAAQHLVLVDFHVRRVSAGVVVGALEANALDVELLVEFNLYPGLLVVRSLPMVPMLLTIAEQVLGLANRADREHVVFSSHRSAIVEVILLKRATNSWLRRGIYLHINCSWLLLSGWIRVLSRGHCHNSNRLCNCNAKP